MTGPAARKAPVAEYWKEFEGIPLCHVASSPDEAEALKKKGVCGPQC